jgi:hypothetical protein
MPSLDDIVEHHVIAEVRNPEGHLVRIDEIAWNHVLDQHVEMNEYLAETMSAIKMPEHREPDLPEPGASATFAAEDRLPGFALSRSLPAMLTV